MSIDFSVQLSLPLTVSQIVEGGQRTLETLLKISPTPLIRASQPQQWVDGEMHFLNGQMLSAHGDSFTAATFMLDASGCVVVTIFLTQPFSPYERHSLTATVSAEGEDRARGGLILAIACAAAIAQQSEAKIEDGALMLGQQSHYEPLQLLEQLRCRETHAFLEDAIEEVLHNIEACKAEA